MNQIERERRTGERLGRMRLTGGRRHYPLVGAYAHRFAARRFALVGDAAVGMHPVTAHGWNFGLYGVEVLARELARGCDAGAPDALAAYERAHRRATWPIYMGTNALVTLFTDDRAPARLARQAVVDAVTRLPGLGALAQSLVVRQLMGNAAARPEPFAQGALP